ncbi:MAG: heme lyase CcmF/NrfE family subunit [Alphaproteobacteria bacterium]|nr:heme lyase CcmF/NrfE family subunit [Alphaproteobacteria bacterium]
MIPELGTGLVLVSLLFATLGAVLGFWAGARRHLGAWAWARRAAYAFAGCMLGANLLMVYALLSHDFSVKYVAEVGSLTTPTIFTIVSLWASLNGSILFWGGILSVYVVAFLFFNGNRHREYMPWTIAMLLSNSVFFALLVSSVANPFARISPAPMDGPGPNPLLQNHWLMAVHPPTLYMGYVGMVVPYSMICAALFAGRLDAGWMVPLRRWMMIPWTFLSVGIVLGGWWSYGVLGWGGAWAWDPVENASFHPWLTGTAFLHSAMLLQRRGDLRIWTLILGIATFLLTLVGTFMTRSGVFNSVHSFTQSSIGPVFLYFIGIVLVFSIVLLAVREHLLVIDQDQQARTTLMSSMFGSRMHPLGREFAILLQNAVFTTFTFTVLLGTLYPLIAEALQDRKVSVGEPYFDRWGLPLGLLLVFLMGVGPALPWGRLSPRRAMERLLPPVVAGFVFTVPFLLNGIDKPYTLLALWLCGFAFWANFNEFVTPVRQRMRSKGEGLPTAATRVFQRTRRRYGGHIAHYGVVLAVIALAISKGYKTEQDVTLTPGQTIETGRFTATFTDASTVKEPHRTAVVAHFAITDGGADAGTLEPRLNYYPRQREPIFTPAVHETLTSDFYLSIVELEPEGKYVVLRVITMPGIFWLWLAPVFIALGSILAMWPTRRTDAAAAPAALPAGSRTA